MTITMGDKIGYMIASIRMGRRLDTTLEILTLRIFDKRGATVLNRIHLHVHR